MRSKIIKKILAAIIIMIIGFLIYLAFATFFNKYPATKLPQKLILKTDSTKDWLSFYNNNKNNIEVYDINFPLEQIGAQLDQSLNPIALAQDMVFLVDMSGKKIWFGGFDKDLEGWKYAEVVDIKPHDCYNPHLVLRDNRVYFTVTGITPAKEAKSPHDRNIYSYIYCYDIENKKVVWDKEVRWKYEYLQDDWDTKLLVYKDKVIVWMEDKDKGENIYCYDAATGNELWKSSDSKGRIVDCYGAAYNDKFYILNSERKEPLASEVIAVDIKTGTVVWKTAITGMTMDVSICILKNKIHFGSSRGMYILGSETGHIDLEIKRDEDKGLIFYPDLILNEDNLYYASTTSGIVCYDDKGDIKWISKNLWLHNLCFLTKTHIWAVDQNTSLVALNRKDGSIDYRLVLGQDWNKYTILQAAVQKNTLYLTTDGGEIFAYKGPE